MAIRSTVQDINYNVIGVRKETESSFQVIFDNYEDEFWIELDRHGLDCLVKSIDYIKKEKHY